MLKKMSKTYVYGIPLASVMLVGSIILLIMGYHYHRLIHAKEFIDLATESVTEAYRLMVLAERYTKFGYGLLIATGCVIVGILVIQLMTSWQRKKKEQASSD